MDTGRNHFCAKCGLVVNVLYAVCNSDYFCGVVAWGAELLKAGLDPLSELNSSKIYYYQLRQYGHPQI